MQPTRGRQSSKSVPSRFAWAVAFGLCFQISTLAQIPNINMGLDGEFAQIDFAQMYLDQINRDAHKRQKQRDQIES